MTTITAPRYMQLILECRFSELLTDHLSEHHILLSPLMVINKCPRLQLEYNKKNNRYIIGVDEAGRGPIAGPVVAAALVCSPSHVNLIGAADSKVLSEKQREKIYQIIKEDPTIYSSFSSVCHTGLITTYL